MKKKRALVSALAIGTSIGATFAILASANPPPPAACKTGCDATGLVPISLPSTIFGESAKSVHYLLVLGDCQTCHSLAWLPSNIDLRKLRLAMVSIVLVPPLKKYDSKLDFISQSIPSKLVPGSVLRFYPALYKIDSSGRIIRSEQGSFFVKSFLASEFK